MPDQENLLEGAVEAVQAATASAAPESAPSADAPAAGAPAGDAVVDAAAAVGGGPFGGMFGMISAAMGLGDQKKDPDELAADQLTGQFEVVPDDFKGKKAANQMTQADLDKMRATYLQVARGQSDLDIDTPYANPTLGTDTPAAKEANNQFHQGVMGDIGELMKTAAGRELVYKLSNNVNKETGEHHKTHITAGDPNEESHTTASYTGARRYNGVGEDEATVQLSHVVGNDADMYRTLLSAEHITTGTEQSGSFERWDYDTRERHVADKDLGKQKEDAALQGKYGYGTRLNGVTETTSEYARERAARRAAEMRHKR